MEEERISRFVTDDGFQVLKDKKEVASVHEVIAESGVTMRMTGRFSNEIVNYLKDELRALALARKTITLNLQDTVYLSYSTMDLFVDVARKLDESGQSVQITNVSREIYQKMRAYGLNELIDIDTPQ